MVYNDLTVKTFKNYENYEKCGENLILPRETKIYRVWYQEKLLSLVVVCIVRDLIIKSMTIMIQIHATQKLESKCL